MQRLVIPTVLVLVALAALGAWHGAWDIAQLESYVEQYPIAGAFACVGAFIVSTVLPISALPLLPLAARVYGVGTTIVLSAAGWWIGCMAAFVIARWARGLLERMNSLDATRRFERKLPNDIRFGGIVILRVIFPGDIVGFALGLLRQVPLMTYALASLLGTIPGAIVFSLAGGELGKGNIVSCALLVSAMVLATLLLKRLLPEKTPARATTPKR